MTKRDDLARAEANERRFVRIALVILIGALIALGAVVMGAL